LSAPLTETAAAKVNLTLRVLGRRPDGYHALESLVVFADLADALTLAPGATNSLAVRGPFAQAAGEGDGNLVLKAANAVPALAAGHFTLDKRIPVAAGIGGGSADAAAALRLIARANGIAADDPRLVAAARATGADVPVCLVPGAKIMRGAGEELTAVPGMPRLSAVLVNPRVAVPTRDVFTAFVPGDCSAGALGAPPHDPADLIGWLADYGNDLTRAAVANAPVIADVLAAIAAQPDCRLSRMSGSGATCFGLFGAMATAEAAAARLRAEKPGWWVSPVTLG
jgi:4-diphosphocytidyl-2-C-methyl-D-erythritol kinase